MNQLLAIIVVFCLVIVGAAATNDTEYQLTYMVASVLFCCLVAVVTPRLRLSYRQQAPIVTENPYANKSMKYADWKRLDQYYRRLRRR